MYCSSIDVTQISLSVLLICLHMRNNATSIYINSHELQSLHIYQIRELI